MTPHEGQRAEGSRARALPEILRRLDLHDHAALVFASEEERAEVAGVFLRLGLERGEACVHLAGATHASRVLPHVREGGLDAGEALASGRLSLATDPRVALRSGYASPTELTSAIHAMVESALSGGARALRLSVEPSWTGGDEASLDRLLACEAAVKEALRDRPVVALFQYDRRRLTAGQLTAALRMHPLVLHRGELCSNALFVPPPSAGGEEDAVERLLEAVKDHHRVDQAFALGRQRLRRALDGGAHGLWDWHLASGRILFDRRRLELCGPERRRSWLQLAEWEQAVHPEDLGPLWRAVRGHLEGQTPRFEHEHRVRQGGGRYRWVCVRGEAVERDRAGQAVRLAGTFTDVSALRAQRERQAARERLASLAALASAIAHEVNNPLAWIGANLGYLRERLREPAADATVSDAAEPSAILSECLEGVSRIRDAVAVLRSVAGPDDGPPAPRDLREELLAAVNLASEELRPPSARVEVVVPDELPPVAAHPALRMVLANLFVQAAQGHGGPASGPPTIRVEARRTDRHVYIEVQEPAAAPGDLEEGVGDPFPPRASGGPAARLAAPFALAIVEAAGGRLETECSTEGFRVTRVVFPIFGKNGVSAPRSHE